MSKPRKRLGRPPLAASGQHAATEVIRARVTPAVYARLVALASERGQSLAELVRIAVEREVKS